MAGGEYMRRLKRIHRSDRSRTGARSGKRTAALSLRRGKRPIRRLSSLSLTKTGMRRRKAVKRMRKQWTSHPHPIVSVIIPVMNERRTIVEVIHEARRVHPETEIIVVSNGTSDGSGLLAERAGAHVIRHANPLGHDVGRTIGAEAAKGEILLFIDGDMVIPAERLKPFIRAVAAGVDVALNDYSGPTNRRYVHRVVLAKHTLNALLSRSDLKGTSMTAVPHALSRRALDTIGADSLSIPPLAHARAVHQGLRVERTVGIDVGSLNPIRTKQYEQDPLTSLIDNDHLQSVRWLIEHAGNRGGYTDLNRQRHLVR